MGLDYSVHALYGFMGSKGQQSFIEKMSTVYDQVDKDYEILGLPDSEVLQLCGYKHLVYAERLDNVEHGEWFIGITSGLVHISPKYDTGVWFLNENHNDAAIVELVELREKLGLSEDHKIGWYVISSVY